MNFTRPVFLVRADLVFVGIRYKHLEYKTSKASPFYTTVPLSLRAVDSEQALSARSHFQFPTHPLSLSACSRSQSTPLNCTP